MNKPLVSVVVPIYNQEDYLRDCLDSLANQTYDNVEIVLVNDGSTDGSKLIIDGFVKYHSNCIVINKNNGGLSDARNAGIKKSKGDYLCFVDGDDIVHPEFVERMVEPLTGRDDIVSCCRYERFKNKQDIKGQDFGEQQVEYVKTRDFLIKMLYQNDQSLYSVMVCNKMWPKKAFAKIKFPVGVLYEDFAIADELLEQFKEINIINNTMYFYRIRKRSITTGKFNKSKLVLVNHCDKYIKKFNKDKEMLAAARSIKYSKLFELLTMIKMSGYYDRDFEKEAWRYIKDERKSIIDNPRSRKLEKISAVLTYFGYGFSVRMNVLRKKVRGF